MQGEILSLPGKKKFNSTGSVSNAGLVREKESICFTQQRARCPEGAKEVATVREAGAPQDQGRAACEGLPLASPFTDTLSGGCKQYKYKGLTDSEAAMLE